MSTQREQQSPIARPGLKLRAKARLGLLSDLRLVAYLSHGTREFLHVKGRLVEAPGLSGSIGKDGSLLSNVLTTLHRIGSEEIPGARLVATFDGRDHDAYTDNEGYFHVNLYPREPLTVGWHDVHVELAESVKEAARTSATARVLVPPEENAFAVVSDLDDTVIQTSATDKLEMIRLTLFENAATRIAFPGIASLYVALTRGADRNGQNPIFYVSRSGWNLSDLFVEFFERNGIPPGPLFLHDLSFWEDKSTALGSVHHKLAQIRELLRAYP
ncbi:MAG TPA: phosphatase domain-containing protein, partial [Steroidobacteraceae bacterium]|nr:phosphatase domain-containing protein [Steroidobacteraceae bacterium]